MFGYWLYEHAHSLKFEITRSPTDEETTKTGINAALINSAY